jgi:hypothetical protein
MSRFYSNYEIEKFDKKLNNEDLFNASKYKMQLKEAINIENQRTNVDSAKKKAVLQGMDYNGFHQMVLGANLKGVKTSELLELKPTTPIMNNVMTQILLGKEKDVLYGNFSTSGTDSLTNLQEKIKIETDYNPKEDYRYLKKEFKSASTTGEKVSILNNKINLIELINCDNLESDFFLEIFYHVGNFILTNVKLETENNKLLKLLEIVINHKQFESLKKFLGKKQKNIYMHINELKNEIFLEKEFLNIFEYIMNKIK